MRLCSKCVGKEWVMLLFPEWRGLVLACTSLWSRKWSRGKPVDYLECLQLQGTEDPTAKGLNNREIRLLHKKSPKVQQPRASWLSAAVTSTEAQVSSTFHAALSGPASLMIITWLPLLQASHSDIITPSEETTSSWICLFKNEGTFPRIPLAASVILHWPELHHTLILG